MTASLPPSLREPLAKLADLIEAAVDGDGSHPFGPVWLSRATAPSLPKAAMYTPMLCLVAQGSKQLILGEEEHVYTPGRFLLNSVPVPASGGVLEASLVRPCLWMMIELDPALVRSVMIESDQPVAASERPLKTLDLCLLTPEILSPILRLAEHVISPAVRDYLAPMAIKEMVYRLLATDQAPRLRQIAASGGRTTRVFRAITWLKDHFHQPMTIEFLASECGLSPSALHHHFKEVTAMTPLQYQKQLRFQEAHRLMINEGLDATRAGLRVGYDDPAHFSRDYRKFFGAPPARHASQHRTVA